METPTRFTGARKAALLLMTTGEEFTAKVFKHLDENEIKTIGEHMAEIKNVDARSISLIAKEFFQIYSGNLGMGVSGRNFLERSISKAFDSRKADNLLDDVLARRKHASFDKLSNLSPHVLANLIPQENQHSSFLMK